MCRSTPGGPLGGHRFRDRRAVSEAVTGGRFPALPRPGPPGHPQSIKETPLTVLPSEDTPPDPGVAARGTADAGEGTR